MCLNYLNGIFKKRAGVIKYRKYSMHNAGHYCCLKAIHLQFRILLSNACVNFEALPKALKVGLNKKDVPDIHLICTRSG